jgi:hypothetical protein
MAGETLELDPVDQDAANSPLTITNTALGYHLLEHAYPTPNRNTQFTASVDADGDAPVSGRYENRTITMRVRVRAATSSDLMGALRNLQQKVGKIAAEGGTLKRTVSNGDVLVFDLITAKIDVPSDQAFVKNLRADVALEFVAKPFGRMAEQDLGDNTETTLPVLVFTDTGVKGDVPALGRLVVDDDQAVDQFWLMWGIQSRSYSSATTAELFYQAEALTAQGGSSTAAGPTGASGSGSNVMRNTSLRDVYQSVLSTQIASGSAHMTHLGNFRVFARVQVPTTNTGGVTVALEWSTGDFRRATRNPDVALYPSTSAPGVWEGTWRIVDLGLVNLPKAVTGAQQWEGRILAKSTVIGDDLDIDWLVFAPVDEGFGIAQGVNAGVVGASSFSAFDGFDQTAGALTGKTLPTGGTWAGAGDSDDFNVNGTGQATRTAVSDSAISSMANGRLASADGTGALTDTEVVTTVTNSVTSNVGRCGVLARYADASNFLAAYLTATGSPGPVGVEVYQRVAGTDTYLAFGLVDPMVFWTFSAGVPIKVALVALSNGQFSVSVDTGSGLRATCGGTSAALATGGALASGRVGIYDHYTSAVANTRTYHTFHAFAAQKDAAMFASQSIQIRHDSVVREDSAGGIWTRVSRYEGDYLFVPPAGRENRTVRTLVKACRADPATGADSAIDDISARLYATPRVLVVPEP